jgi:hypothetical protein
MQQRLLLLHIQWLGQRGHAFAAWMPLMVLLVALC